MPTAYQPEYKPLPDAPGFWLDAFLTNYGFAVVTHPSGALYALGWAEEPVPVDTLRTVPQYEEKIPIGVIGEGRPSGVVHAGGYLGPLPVPSHRRYELRKLKREFRDAPPLHRDTSGACAVCKQETNRGHCACPCTDPECELCNP